MRGVDVLRHLSLQRLRGGAAAVTSSSSSIPTMNSAMARFSSTVVPANVSSPEEEILVEERYCTKVAILNRPGKLNALNTTMVTRLKELYTRWEKDHFVHLVIIKGNGRGFCAGGDVAQVYHLGKAGKKDEAFEFFRQEYLLNYLLGTYKKPHVAFLNGVVMGGGTGISVHGSFRVATENSKFAMPETAIGLHPDVGASYYLSRLPGHLGEFLGLTGTRLDGADMVACNLATHFVPSHRLGMLEERLGSLNTLDRAVISKAIDEFCDIVHLNENSPLHRRQEIDSCFGRSSMEEIIRTIEAGVQSGNPWFQETLAKLKKSSPLSLKITLRSVREGRKQHLFQCLQREFRLSLHAIEGKFSNDFAEGCRAVLVDKDNAPKWNPATLEQVTTELVDYHFSPVAGDLGEELELSVEAREPNLNRSTYARL
ncbi:3-hydroxyisobutyryl-CoA hydrolase [Marchantia polymorpha subsp. ruderalis]|uniref:3-hydroxyisobutyryl-CoA hydrolase n=1 Tax=Marchantia polymorpha TaxID=3197 RepID=A0A2R6XIT1_MARPO|nr:hypothetical protein MARPO_0013s0174 [Marchantia polymorpha]BBN18865.1 hypothetical protein Mp_8g06160 [Marchantia polymorpha subsp. ruderalis]|eukprot:PTQ45979.1 hypothetical protein MARPO_0013s0174 [Marchantia polymorpha]